MQWHNVQETVWEVVNMISCMNQITCLHTSTHDQLIRTIIYLLSLHLSVKRINGGCHASPRRPMLPILRSLHVGPHVPTDNRQRVLYKPAYTGHEVMVSTHFTGFKCFNVRTRMMQYRLRFRNARTKGECITTTRPVLHHPSVHIKTREASKVYPKCFKADHVTVSQWDSRGSGLNIALVCKSAQICAQREGVLSNSLPQWAPLLRAINGFTTLSGCQDEDLTPWEMRIWSESAFTVRTAAKLLLCTESLGHTTSCCPLTSTERTPGTFPCGVPNHLWPSPVVR